MRTVLAAGLVVAAAGAQALAHGGNYGPGSPPPDPGPPLGPPWHGPKFDKPDLTPGGEDPKVAVTRWETWWANNKTACLRLRERLTANAPGTTGAKREPSEREKEAARKRADALRRRLAGVFTEALADPDFEVRTAAAIALGKSGEPSGSAPLRAAATRDAHDDVRDSAVLGLGLLGQPADVPFLELMLHDAATRPRRRAFAAFAIGLIGGDDAGVALVRFAEERPEGRKSEMRKRHELAASVYVAMGLSGSAATAEIVRAAAADEDIDANVRSFAVISLGRLGDRASLDRVATMLASEREPGLRRAAAVALGRLAQAADARAVTTLVTALREDRDVVTRHFAATSLGWIGGDLATASLREDFAKGTDDVRSFAALGLGLARDQASAPAIRAALEEEKDESVAGSYCVALGLLDDVASAPAIRRAMERAKKVWLRGYAALALGMCGDTASIEPLHLKLVKEGDPRLRMSLAIALGMLHDPRARSLLADTLRGAETFFERGSAALALGALRMHAAVPDLEVVYREKGKDLLRAFAIVALGDIADPAAVPRLSRFAVDGNYDATLNVDPLNEVLSIY